MKLALPNSVVSCSSLATSIAPTILGSFMMDMSERIFSMSSGSNLTAVSFEVRGRGRPSAFFITAVAPGSCAKVFCTFSITFRSLDSNTGRSFLILASVWDSLGSLGRIVNDHVLKSTYGTG